MFELVVVLNVYLVSVLVRAVAPVAVPRSVPAALLSCNFARGNIVPPVVVFRSQSANVIVEPAGIVPETFGSPACVSKALMSYSPATTFFRLADVIARLVPSGPAVFNWNRPEVAEASLCK